MAEENGKVAVLETNTNGNGFHKSPPAPASNCRRRRRCLYCVGCLLVTLSSVALVMLVLALTVYKVRGPEMKLNSIVISGAGNTTTIVVDASVKNPNPVAYYFEETTTSFYYKDFVIGEASTPSGRAGAHRTYRSNLTMMVATDDVVNMVVGGGLDSDTVPIETATKVSGHVMILGLVKRHVDVAMNCTVAVAVANFTIVDQSCSQHVSL